MPAPIAPIASLSADAAELLAAPKASQADGFSAVLAHAIQGVQDIQQASAQSVEKFLAGDGQELHTTVLATQRAELSFELFLQVRNKVVAAYQEIMRMQE
jgi:flagellar hook-basal body complex protein FliE